MSTEPDSETPSPETLPDLVEEQDLGGSPGGSAANAALKGLSRAARSFLIYEPHNAAIRTFLENYRKAIETALGFGPMELDIRPFEMVRQGEVVYLERDRSRSLAFRLFRDGVRKLTFLPEVPWEQLLKILEILSIRYTGVRQQEDDIVTLLWKAGFSHIQISAVEGFVPDEDEGERAESEAAAEASQQTEREGMKIEIPGDWDFPRPAPLDPKPIKYIALPADYFPKLHETSADLPRLCLRLIDQLLDIANDVTDPTTLDEVIPTIEEIRDFFLADGQLQFLRQLIDSLQKVPEEIRAKYMAGFASEQSLKKILHTIPKGVEEAPPELVALLESLPGDHVGHLVAVLSIEKGETQRRVLRRLLVRFCGKNPKVLVEGVRSAESGLARELLKVIEEAAPQLVVEAAMIAVDRGELELRLEAHRILDSNPGPGCMDAIRRLMSASEQELRMRAIQSLSRHHDTGAFPMMLDRLQTKGVSEPEADALGVAMAQLNPTRARVTFEKWITPSGMFQRWVMLPGQHILWWGAVSGLTQLPGNEIEPLIKGILEKVDADLRQHAVASLVRRRKRLQSGNS
jgi:hypothetical protein